MTIGLLKINWIAFVRNNANRREFSGMTNFTRMGEIELVEQSLVVIAATLLDSQPFHVIVTRT